MFRFCVPCPHCDVNKEHHSQSEEVVGDGDADIPAPALPYCRLDGCMYTSGPARTGHARCT